eukprot:CAMPEP_0172165490 /NCGR_PEP_ID=MMETSP1050-20130122/8442_1 /TAXON_ID=233186 /ORGANISM="Cryptomonas curvata, Strain CCAP979/52" /LENGTH=118 /DNA_ID=CAMNT_0012835969 /DNA_START=115 /DNA_END=468 /DNA_ORIENTATION=+
MANEHNSEAVPPSAATQAWQWSSLGTLSEGDENDGSFYGSIPRSKPFQAEETDDSSNTGVNPVASSAQGDAEQQTPHGNAPLPSTGSSGTRQWRNLTEPPSPGGRSKGTGGLLSPSSR